jgi:hypothetical protein
MDISTTYQNPTAQLNLKGNLFVLYRRFWSTYVWSEIDPPVYRQLCPCSYIIQCLIRSLARPGFLALDSAHDTTLLVNYFQGFRICMALW